MRGDGMGPGNDALDRRGFFARGLQRAMQGAVDAFSERLAPVSYIRPPGALPEAAFIGACTRCGACAEVCPVHVISMLPSSQGLAAGTPVIDVASAACIMCETMPCAASCPTPALDLPAWGWRDVQMAKITIDSERCITWRDVECGICARVCPVGEDALRVDARGHPVLGDACTGCGQCISACVTSPSSIAAEPIYGR